MSSRVLFALARDVAGSRRFRRHRRTGRSHGPPARALRRSAVAGDRAGLAERARFPRANACSARSSCCASRPRSSTRRSAPCGSIPAFRLSRVLPPPGRGREDRLRRLRSRRAAPPCRTRGFSMPFFANKLEWQGGDRWRLAFPHSRSDCRVGSANCKCSHGEPLPRTARGRSATADPTSACRRAPTTSSPRDRSPTTAAAAGRRTRPSPTSTM